MASHTRSELRTAAGALAAALRTGSAPVRAAQRPARPAARETDGGVYDHLAEAA
jgi:hypothetical protein